MLASLIASGLVVGASVVAYKNFNVNKDNVRIARIKNLMNLVDAQVRRRAIQPESYINCNSTGGVASCALDPTLFNDLNNKNVSGAKCGGAPGTACGVRVENAALNVGSRNFSARIVYHGSEANLKPIDVTIRVPTEVLQTSNFLCPGTTPFFAGFQANGAPDCQGFRNTATYQNGQCISGYFVSHVDISTRTVDCSPMPANIQCGDQNAEKFFTINWVNGTPNYNCNSLDTPPYTPYRNFRVPGSAPPPNRVEPVITSSVEPQTATDTIVHTVTATYTRTTTNTATDPPPAPVCSTQLVHVGGANQGATPRYFGGAACNVSCQGSFNSNSAYFAGGCTRVTADGCFAGIAWIGG